MSPVPGVTRTRPEGPLWLPRVSLVGVEAGPTTVPVHDVVDVTQYLDLRGAGQSGARERKNTELTVSSAGRCGRKEGGESRPSRLDAGVSETGFDLRGIGSRRR